MLRAHSVGGNIASERVMITRRKRGVGMNRRKALTLTVAAAASALSRSLTNGISSPVPPGSSQPNVLFILCDQLNAGILGCYGGPLSTPNIDRLVRSGVLFTNATCVFPL